MFEKKTNERAELTQPLEIQPGMAYELMRFNELQFIRASSF